MVSSTGTMKMVHSTNYTWYKLYMVYSGSIMVRTMVQIIHGTVVRTMVQMVHGTVGAYNGAMVVVIYTYLL